MYRVSQSTAIISIHCLKNGRLTSGLSLLLALLVCACVNAQPVPAVDADTFINPLLPSGADPSVAFHDGYYYYMQTTGKDLTIWKTRDITDLADAEKKIVWTPPASGPDSHEIWAPELHFVEGKWYIYFAADAGSNDSHRLFVLQNASRDPLAGTWTFKGELRLPGDKWAIDPSVFSVHRKLYVIWSGWEGDRNGEQDIYIARLKNPWTVTGPRVKVSSPELDWEKFGDLPNGNPAHVNVNEGPEVLEHGSKIFLIYSASGCWTDHYALGMLTAESGSDLLNPASWKKAPQPVFSESPAAHAFGTGHNSFFRSPDGKQDWIVYHANPASGEGCGNFRSPRAQPFTWNADGTPNFGTPVPIDTPLPKPSVTAR